jgi:hypothetical protein
MSDSLVNYRENYFQHPVLTKIIGDPTYTSLAKLERECKANAKSVRSTLGGGNQGHLGLVSSIPAYERISPGMPFIRPLLPVLPPLDGATAAQIAVAQEQYDNTMTNFKACNLIERTIMQQINTAIDDDCLADLIDDDTGLLEGTVPTIFQELYSTYGAITPQSLAAAKTEVEATTYNHSRPITNIFTNINEYAHMAEHADATETPAQLINIGLIIITRSTIYANDIRTWNAKPDIDKTWPNFKEHFKAAQKAIKRSQPTVTADSLGYHEQANTASTTAPDQALAIFANDQAAEQLAAQQMQCHLTNMASSAQTNQAIVEQMQALATTMSGLQTQVTNQRRGRGGGRGGGGRGGGGRGGRGGRGGGRGNEHNRRNDPLPAQVRQYCWSHGNSSHNGTQCRAPAEGHIATATYDNMQGGSTYNCNGH